MFVGIRAYRLAGWSLAREGGWGAVGHGHAPFTRATRLHACVYTALMTVAGRGRTLLSSFK